MRRRALIATPALLLFVLVAIASQKPDFSGSWSMDRGRSYGLPGDMDQKMTVKQTADEVQLETKLIQPSNERSVKDSYMLDGKEHDFNPFTPPNAPPAKGKRTATWLPSGNGIVVNEVTTSESDKGPVVTKITRKWTVTNDGELVIDMYFDTPNGSFETKRIFKKS
jgi:hypothetical protein